LSKASPEPIRVDLYDIEVDELVTSLAHSGVLDTLGITEEDSRQAQTDSDLLETFRIAYELLDAFQDSGVLDIFLRLPKWDQANFIRWIAMTDDGDLRRDRTKTFVVALEKSPLGHALPSRARADNR
jgi:hypothetical protein